MLRALFSCFVIAASLFSWTYSASAADRSERAAARRAKRSISYDARQVKQSPNSSQDDYAARASDNDPGGTYKSYADWARAALGTKPYGR